MAERCCGRATGGSTRACSRESSPRSIPRPRRPRRSHSTLPPAALPASSSIRRGTCNSIPRRAPRGRMNTRSAWIGNSGRRLAVAVAYVRKDGGNFIGWTDVGGQYREETRTLADGSMLPVWMLANSSADRRFLLTNPAGYSLTYNGFVMAAEKRLSNGWQAFGSYTFSRASGLQVSSGANAAGSQVSTIAGNPYLTFGQDPNSLTNARGRLPNDRPHMLRVMGSVDVPQDGVRGRCQRATFERQAVGGDDADYAARRATSASCSSRAERAGCRRRRLSTCACRGRSASADWGASSCSWTCSTRSTTRRKRAWRTTTCSPEFRPALSVHGSAARDAGREAEPGPVILGSSRDGGQARPRPVFGNAGGYRGSVRVTIQMSDSVARREKYATRPSRVRRGGPMTSRVTEKTGRTCFVWLSMT